MVENNDYEANRLKLETIETTIKSLIDEYNKISPKVHGIKLALVSGYVRDLALNLSVYDPESNFNFDYYDNTNRDGWYSSGCSF